MKLINKAQGNILATMFLVIITLVIFFTTFGLLDTMVGVAEDAYTGDSDAIPWMISAIPFIVIVGLIIWIINPQRE